ncbi:MAG: MazG nucleotide pyrophosphohydrolase domain-containing protein [Candidatus Heimdallarchaeota archaeon]
MQLKELSELVNQFIMRQGGYWNLPWMLAALTEELGELSRAAQVYGDLRVPPDPRAYQKKRHTKDALLEMAEECGDLLFALLCLTNSLGINLEAELLKSLEKYSTRADS